MNSVKEQKCVTRNRKERNRQSQAAFRFRRKKYIKELEESIMRMNNSNKRLNQELERTVHRAEKAERQCLELYEELHSLRKLTNRLFEENKQLTQYCSSMTANPLFISHNMVSNDHIGKSFK
ncbi:hypothetical protein BCV72DRAFT_308114 [Rhizopus microsporus var. microsporus]|uniref:BZIP domain-containing protein n=2 Tax=Rhizopus microsporus TaxID=58291 RepID=A0A2G4SM09_RHIZD|nr:uncharacterized protein RHIMIDRAFT_240474 [Rhizopus microsporus ATCC 52813]ORE03566.1 hypothetical protein BCV72DRAFT_308114 [Rhizopus microsporus var. microsporus]PHZ09800.1 hypothetical protein RHIMIDRAFT_240474 [Rhizopus microsporus ATCC 52813]